MKSLFPLGPATSTLLVAAMLGILGTAASSVAGEGDFALRLRSRVEDKAHPGQFALIEQAETWNPKETAVIVCDMWDLHHCLNAVRRGGELAPTMDRVLKTMRDRGATVIHSPSECMDAYKDHAARRRAIDVPRSKDVPVGIGEWCKLIPSEERGVYPIDQTDGGEDDDPTEHAEWAAKLTKMGRNPRAPWKSQTDALTIDADKDYISVGGEEIWSILEQRGIKNVVLLGVHLNMCVLGRPFGLRQMAKNGRKVVLMRDMTDTMYNPAMPPKVNHFAGTDLMVEHVEKYVAPTITSDQILGGAPFVFKGDTRPHLAILIAEDEYRTEVSLPAFASKSLTDGYRVSYILPDPARKDVPANPDRKNALAHVSALNTADVALISVRRRPLPEAQLDAVTTFVNSGKPVVGIRTASHAFSPLANQPLPEGHAAWVAFDADVLGGHYHGHHDASKPVAVSVASGAESHPILAGVDATKILGHGTLYKVSPLAKTTTPLLIGSIPDQEPEPVAWTNMTAAKGRVFYTSLGQIDDFASLDFARMLKNAIDWSVRRDARWNALLILLVHALVLADDPPGDIRDLKLRDWQPRSMMVTKTTLVERPKFPVIDIHNHLGGGKQRLTPSVVKGYLAEMDAAGVQTVVNLDGGWDDRLKETIAALDEAHPGRFLTFSLVDFGGIDDAGWSDREAKRLEASFLAGAKGLKFHKSFGLSYRYKDGTLVPVDDPKLDPIWEMCAKHNRPVVIHVADPAAFFTPLDKFNERWHELNQNPGWLFFGDKFPKRQVLLDQLHRVIAKHPKTTFINTHFGNNAEDLGSVADKLDKYPNMFVDIDARISELGRQPYSARKFFVKYQDRILFGTDTTPNREAYRIYYRFLETDDEYFDCSASHHRQGFWPIYGIFLPDDVLDKVYRKNAERLFPSLKRDEPKTATKELKVRPTADFEITGDGSASAWEKAEWEPLVKRNANGLPYETRVKLLYSSKGLYVLMDATDAKVSVSDKEDFADLWKEDVMEFFLWPDERDPLYFEYEISPLNRELILLVPNLDGKQLGWKPWHYEADRKTRKATSVSGGTRKAGTEIAGWKAEVFIPYTLLAPLRNVPPRPGTRWRANFYRMDYDGGKTTSWDWSRVGPSFHDFANFGTLVFE